MALNTNSNYSQADKDLAAKNSAFESAINSAKSEWEAANKAGDTAGMEAAHAKAEMARAVFGGYSGGVAGDQHNLITASSDSVGYAPMTMSVSAQGPSPVDNSGKIEEYYKQLEEKERLEIEKAISEGRFNLNASLQAALPGFQTSRQQADYQTEQNAQAVKEQMALMGDRGGMSRQDILQNQTSGANMLNTINMQERKLRDDTQSQIDQLVNQGNLQGAIMAAQIGAERINALISESNRIQEALYRQWQDSFNNSLTMQQWAYSQQQDQLDRDEKARETAASYWYNKAYM